MIMTHEHTQPHEHPHHDHEHTVTGIDPGTVLRWGSEIVGSAKPIAYALDGFAIYGSPTRSERMGLAEALTGTTQIIGPD